MALHEEFGLPCAPSYLPHADTRIAANGGRRVLARHTYDARMFTFGRLSGAVAYR